MKLGPERDFFIVLILIIPILTGLSLKRNSETYDEKHHFTFGWNALHGSFDRDKIGVHGDSKLPISVLNAIPALFFDTQDDEPPRDILGRTLHYARSATVIFSMVCGFFVYWWSRRLYGIRGGIFSLFLYTFSPNIMAQAQLVTTDLYYACLGTIAVYFFWRALNEPTGKNWFWSVLSLSLLQITKFNAVLFYPLFGLMAMVYFFPNIRAHVLSKNFKGMARSFGRTIGLIGIYGLAGILLINSAFLFDGWLTPLGQYKFSSDIGLFLQQRLPWLSSCPLFLPYSYVEGFDLVRFIERSVHPPNIGQFYFWGQIRPQPVPGYFYFCYLLKEPIAYQLFLLVAVVLFFKHRSEFNFRQNELFLVIPAVFFFLYINFYFRIQIGIRYFIIVLPFLYVFCGSVFKPERELRRPHKIAYGLAGLYALVSVMSYFPYYIPYFNEIVWDRTQAYRYLADSNLDWGQGEYARTEYARQHPEVKIMPEKPATGRILVDVNNFLGVNNLYNFDWLKKYQPIGHVAHCYLLFDVPIQSDETDQAAF